MFQQIAQQLVIDFYVLLKRYVDNDERIRVKETLDYNPVNDDLCDQDLLKKLRFVYSYLHSKVETRPRGYYSYSGIDQYFRFLESFLRQYCIYSGRVYHRAQRLSGLILHIIQAIGVPKGEFTSAMALKLQAYCREVFLLGSEDHSVQVSQLLRQSVQQHPLIKPVLDDFKSLSKTRDHVAA